MKNQRQASPRRGGSRGNGFRFVAFMRMKEQLRDLLVFGIIYFIAFILVFVFFKYPVNHPDSGNYILASITGHPGGFRPIGYSWFLSWIYSLSSSVFMIFISQYLLFAISGLYFIFTIKYFFKPQNRLFFILFSSLIILSPTAIYLTNTILSDSIFISYTLLWLTSGIWLLKGIKPFTLAIHLIFLTLAINTRYIGMFYPFVSVLILLLSEQTLKWRLIAATLPVLIVFFSVRFTVNQIEKIYLVRTFSAFSGWSLANNAVSVIPYTDIPSSDFDDPVSQAIHRNIVNYHDSTFSTSNIMDTRFIWGENFPGKQIMFDYARQTRQNYYVAWVNMGVYYKKYGQELIRKAPGKYFRHYIVPNTRNAFKYFPIPVSLGLHPEKQLIQRYHLRSKEYQYLYNPIHIFNYTRLIFHHLTWLGVFISFILVSLLYFRKKLTGLQIRIFMILLIFIASYIILSIISHPVNNFRYMMPLYAVKIMIPYIVLNLVFAYNPNLLIKKQPAISGLSKRN